MNMFFQFLIAMIFGFSITTPVFAQKSPSAQDLPESRPNVPPDSLFDKPPPLPYSTFRPQNSTGAGMAFPPKNVAQLSNESMPIATTISYDPHIKDLAISTKHQNAARILTNARMLTPSGRREYFTSHYTNPATQIRGWRAVISSVQPAESGVIASVRVYATLESEIDSSFLIERYSIIDGNVQYLGSSVPVLTTRFRFH